MASADGSGQRERVRVILVVDDVEDNRELSAMVLRRAGFLVEVAGSGVQAVEVAARVRPLIVVMDLAMPDMDGFEAARRIRALPTGREIHIVAMSAFSDGDTRARATRAGCDHYLTKPCDPARLVDHVRDVLSIGRER